MPDIFYPEAGAAGQDQAETAKVLCASCPVRLQCLNQALSTPVGHDWGIWGGTTENQRHEIRRKPVAAWSRGLRLAAGSLAPDLITMGDHDGRTA